MRIERFLASARWSPQDLSPPMLADLLRCFFLGQYPPIIVDQSTLAGCWEMLWAAIPFRRRAVPFASRLFRYEDIRARRERPQRTSRRLSSARCSACCPIPRGVLLCDWGYARVALFRLVEGLRVHCVVRVGTNV